MSSCCAWSSRIQTTGWTFLGSQLFCWMKCLYSWRNVHSGEKKRVKASFACEKTNREVRSGNGTKSGSSIKLLNDRSLWQVTVKWAWCSVLICVGWTNNDRSLLIVGSDEREFIDNDNERREVSEEKQSGICFNPSVEKFLWWTSIWSELWWTTRMVSGVQQTEKIDNYKNHRSWMGAVKWSFPKS